MAAFCHGSWAYVFTALMLSIALYLDLMYTERWYTLPPLTYSIFDLLSIQDHQDNVRFAAAQMEHSRSSICAFSREDDLVVSVESRTIAGTNLILACPDTPGLSRESYQRLSITQQLATYIGWQLQQADDERVKWIFFLKDHKTFVTHSPRSLEKFLPPTASQIDLIWIDNGDNRSVHGLFAIRVSQWSLKFLNSALKLGESRPDTFEAEAIATAVKLKEYSTKVAQAPNWWMDVKSNCDKIPSSWESAIGVVKVVKVDELCCLLGDCVGNQKIIQNPVKPIPESYIEKNVRAFWAV